MPIFKHNNKLLYFAHVPKCAGTSVEDYLSVRFGPAAFLDRRHAPGNKHNWSRISPQHISAKQLERLFPTGFFDDGFTIVRDPLARARSAFYYHQRKRGKIDAEHTFESWLPKIETFDAGQHARFDDHFRPQSDFVPDWCKVFYMEKGLDTLTQWLDDWSGSVSERNMGHALPGLYDPHEFSEDVIAFVHNYYAPDYERFGPFTSGQPNSA